MKRFIPLIVLVIFAGWFLGKVREPKNTSAFDLNGFGKLPVLANGRIKPLDTVARTSLLALQHRQRVSDLATPEPFVETPIQWAADVMFAPEKADTYPTFKIDSPELLTLMGIDESLTKLEFEGAKRVLAIFGFIPSNRTRFSYKQLEPRLEELHRQYQLAQPIDPAGRTPFQRAVVQLYANLSQYHEIKHTLVMPGSPDFLSELLYFQQIIPLGVEAVRAKESGKTFNNDAYLAMMESGRRYDFLGGSTRILAVPPADHAENKDNWKTTGNAILEVLQTGNINPTALAYAGLASAWRNNKPEQFNKIIELYTAELNKRVPEAVGKVRAEARFNAAEPFDNSMTLFVVATLLALVSWLRWPAVLNKSAFYVMTLAWVATTIGIIVRMWLEGRPPVTNLYSSALFVGWGAVLLCIFLEKLYKNGIGSVAGGVIGFIALLIANRLSLSGDTLEMMRAVLDSNFWLATHVIVITAGYSATFLAGFLGIIYVLRGLFTGSLDKATADALARMVYGIVCFATLFSLIGTILGGIWADQSWGRFWGWDPKENGALIIVLWNAIILHARWGGLVKQRGLMCLAIGGNIVTSWSWFGTNMLGVGLHSYGFMDAAFFWLLAFVFTQLAIIAAANVPLEKWRSFRQTKVTAARR